MRESWSSAAERREGGQEDIGYCMLEYGREGRCELRARTCL